MFWRCSGMIPLQYNLRIETLATALFCLPSFVDFCNTTVPCARYGHVAVKYTLDILQSTVHVLYLNPKPYPLNPIYATPYSKHKTLNPII